MPATETVSAKEAQKQVEELRPRPQTREAPKSAPPGSHPLKPLDDDPEALQQYRGESAKPKDPEDGLWRRTAYGGVVFIPGDRMPAAKGSAG